MQAVHAVPTLAARLREQGIERLAVFPGSRPASADDVAHEVHRVLDALQRGDFELVEHS